MNQGNLKMLLIGGPTLLIEWYGVRILTDPTFDPAGSSYPTGPITLTKTRGPTVSSEMIGPIDAVLLSHDQHSDNLDVIGRSLLPQVDKVWTTKVGASRLGGTAVGLAPWDTDELATPEGGHIRITATPARHGPEGCEPICGEVIGFVLQHDNYPNEAIYISGDTVWYDGIAEVVRRFPVTTAVLFLGAARLDALGPDHLTMNGVDAVVAGLAFAKAKIIPVHYDSWAHFSEGKEMLSKVMNDAGLKDRVLWLEPGKKTEVN